MRVLSFDAAQIALAEAAGLAVIDLTRNLRQGRLSIYWSG
jgi:hypothetical protein